MPGSTPSCVIPWHCPGMNAFRPYSRDRARNRMNGPTPVRWIAPHVITRVLLRREGLSYLEPLLISGRLRLPSSAKFALYDRNGAGKPPAAFGDDTLPLGWDCRG